MAVVNVTINGRVYDIACDDSQVARVHVLGREVDARAHPGRRGFKTVDGRAQTAHGFFGALQALPLTLFHDPSPYCGIETEGMAEGHASQQRPG